MALFQKGLPFTSTNPIPLKLLYGQWRDGRHGKLPPLQGVPRHFGKKQVPDLMRFGTFLLWIAQWETGIQ